MHTPTDIEPAVSIPAPRDSTPRRISLGVDIPIRSGPLKDCVVTVRVRPLGLQQRGDGGPFIVTITPQPAWTPPTAPCAIPFDGAGPVSICASAKDVEELLASEGLTWR